MLRDFCCLPFHEIATRLEIGESAAYGRWRHHRQLLAENPSYAERVAELVAASMARFLPGGVSIDTLRRGSEKLDSC